MLSVIVPVYNAEAHLRQCLGSVLGQTIRDIEVICVDDGSADGSAAVLAAFAANDARVRVISQPENLGQGAARNRGLDAARGEYVYFMDADDELAAADAFGRLVEEADRERLDALFFDAETRADEGVDLSKTPVNPADYMRKGDCSGVFTGQELFARLLRRNEYCVCPYLALFRRGFLSSAGVRFPDARLFYEDNIFMTRVMLAAERASHRRWRLYLRKVHAESTVTARTTPRHVEGYRACLDDVRSLLARGGWSRATRLSLMDRQMVYLREIHRLEGTARPLSERIAGLLVSLRCRSFAYTVNRAFQLLCRRSQS